MADYQKAEELRKAGRFSDAEPLFAELWAQSGDRMVGWRYAFCLRKQGKFDEALETGYEVVERFPEDQWSKNELIWAIYDAKIKPAKEQQDLDLVLATAEEAIQFGASDLALKLIAFAVIDTAKLAGKWDLVANWCDRLDYTSLSAETTQLGDHQMMSDRERWFFARIKAAGELKHWETARTLGLEASQTFPRRKDFSRWAAKALAEQGEVEQAIVELRELLKRGKPEWYLYQDLALCQVKAGDKEGALRNCCEAALAYGDHKTKVNVYALLARLWLERGDLLPAAQAAALARVVREQEGWSIPASLQQLEEEIRREAAESNVSLEEVPNDYRRLEHMLREALQQGVEAGVELCYGVITRLPPEKDFGFLRREDGGGDVYFKRREVPRAYLKEGQRVAFILEPAFDAKKQQETVRAVKIRPA